MQEFVMPDETPTPGQTYRVLIRANLPDGTWVHIQEPTHIAKTLGHALACSLAAVVYATDGLERSALERGSAMLHIEMEVQLWG